MRRVLVTGAAGFVGGHLVTELARRLTLGGANGDRLVGVGRGRPERVPPGATFHEIDLLDRAALAGALRALAPTHIVHLAALSSVQQATRDPTEVWRSNVVGLLNLAEAAVATAPGAVVLFASSGEVYGRSFLAGAPLDEMAEPVPAGSYARTKWVGEQIVRDVLPAGDLKPIIVRPFNHVGPGQDERFVVASFAAQIARIEAGAEPVIEVGNLAVARDFLDIDDVVRAYADLIDRSDAIEPGAVFNVASGVPRPVEAVLAGLLALSPRRIAVRVVPDRVREAEIPTAAGDAGLLTRTIGWRPQRDWGDTLARVLADARLRVADRPGPA